MEQDSAASSTAVANRKPSSTSSDSYFSCFHRVPSNCDHGDCSEIIHPANLYVNPLDSVNPAAPLGPPEHVCDDEQTPGKRRFVRPCKQHSNQVVQKIDKGLTATWHRPPFRSATRELVRSQSRDSTSRRRASLKQWLRRQKSDGHTPPQGQATRETTGSQHHHPHFNVTATSPPNSVPAQAPVKPVGGSKFRRGPFSSRMHASPSTGKKLANYHLIPFSKAGEWHMLKPYIL